MTRSLWNGTPLLAPARAPPDVDAGPWTREPCDDVDPMPDYENGPPTEDDPCART